MVASEGPQPLLEDVLGEFAQELTSLLDEQGETDLAAQVPHLRLFERCRCGDDFCATVYTAPRPKGAWGPEHENVALDPVNGFLILDVVNRAIVSIEVLYRDDIRAEVLQLFP